MLFQNDFADFLTLFNDEYTVFGVSHTYTLKIEILYRSVFVIGNDIVYTGVVTVYIFLDSEVAERIPILSGGIDIFLETNPNFCGFGKFEFDIVAVEIGIVDEASCCLIFKFGVAPTVAVFIYIFSNRFVAHFADVSGECSHRIYCGRDGVVPNHVFGVFIIILDCTVDESRECV